MIYLNFENDIAAESPIGDPEQTTKLLPVPSTQTRKGKEYGLIADMWPSLPHAPSSSIIQ